MRFDLRQDKSKYGVFVNVGNGDVFRHDNPNEPTGAERIEQATGMLPDGYVVVDRSRFERLCVLSLAACRWDHHRGGPKDPESTIALIRAIDAIQPGDLDPLPEE